jgi:hypothetical protein
MRSLCRVVAFLLFLLVASMSAAQTAPAAPTIARISGDGSGVSLAWYAAKGAADYEVQRSRDAKADMVTLAKLPAGTLGYEDRSSLQEPVYYRIVAVGDHGARASGEWFLYAAPVVTSAVADAMGVVVSWSGVASAPGGYEVWRTPDVNRAPIRVGAVGAGTLVYRDVQPATGPSFYRVVARGAGGASAASAWFGVSVSTANRVPPIAAAATPAGSPPTAIGSAGTIARPATSVSTDVAPATPSSAIVASNPSPIADLKVTAATETTVSLSWSSVPEAIGYRVYHALGNGSPELVATQAPVVQTAALATTTLAGLNEFTDGGLLPDASYVFEVSPVYPSVPQPVGKPTGVNEGPRAGPVLARTLPGVPPAKIVAWFEAAGPAPADPTTVAQQPQACAEQIAAQARAEQNLANTCPSQGQTAAADVCALLQKRVEYAMELAAVCDAQTKAAQANAADAATAKAALDAALAAAALLTPDAVLANAAQAAYGLLFSDPVAGQTPASVASAPGTSLPVDVHLEWPRVSEAAGYLVFRDGNPLVLPTAPVTDTHFTDAEPPPGAHVYSVASVFQTVSNGYVEGVLESLPSVSVPVNYGYYRVLLQQVFVNQPTNDTLLDMDGKGDEIFATVHTFVAADLAGVTGVIVPTTAGGVRSRTYGDVNNQSDRVLAGSRSDQGGLQTGDSIPENASPCQPTATGGCLPLEVFRGVLAKGLIGAYIVPRIWEWDGLDLLAAPLAQRLSVAKNWLRSELQHGVDSGAAQRERVLSSPSGGAAVPASLAAIFPSGAVSVPLSTLVGADGYSSTLEIMESAQSLLGKLDRPIGIASFNRNPTTFKGTYDFDEQVIPLSYELADALSSGALAIPPLGKGAFVVTFADRDDSLGGIYTLEFVVEKCASLNQC